MKTSRQTSLSGNLQGRENAKLRARLAEAEETIRAIRSGEVDVVVVTKKQGLKMFTLDGAEHAYRVLIESMNEGALTLTAERMILYANQCFARMVKCPLEQVIGGFLPRFLSEADQATLIPLLKRPTEAGSKVQVTLNAGDGSCIPVQVSIRPLAKNGFNNATVSIVVTDMTEARRNEEMLRALSHRLVQVQEAERGRVALELHDRITQLLCGLVVRCQTLSDKLSLRDKPLKKEATKLRQMLGETAEEVERISRNLRPSVLNELGLVAVLRDASTEFAARTGVVLKLVCVSLTERLPADVELALYRILQEALKNVEKHAGARNVTVCLTKQVGLVQLVINDDGMGFNPDRYPAKQKGQRGLGLLSMRERASSVGGSLKIKSKECAGTEIEIRIPLPTEVRRLI